MARTFDSTGGEAVLYRQPHRAPDGGTTLVVQWDTERAIMFDLSAADCAALAGDLVAGAPAARARGCEHSLCYDADGHWDGCMEDRPDPLDDPHYGEADQ